MNTPRSRRLASLLALMLPVWSAMLHAQPAASTAPETPNSAVTSPDTPNAAEPAPPDAMEHLAHERFEWRHRHDKDLVNIGHDTDLPRGERADSVVSINGSSTSEGEAGEVVSILGNTRVSGPVTDSAVAVLGNTYVDSTVGQDVVAVFGNVELGPHAEIGGDVVAVGGTVQRDPAAIIHGSVNGMAGSASGFGWLRPWIDHCLFYGRPLALVPGIDWAWGIALALLALYVCCALLFRESVTRCVQTIEVRPGMTALAALLTVLLAPVLLVLLCITVIGIAAVPFVVIALVCAGLFGKAVMLAWLGRRCLGQRPAGPLAHPASAVLIGGVIVLALYLVPVLGFVVYQLLGFLGLGAVVYTLILAAQARRAVKLNGFAPFAPPGAMPPGAVPPGAVPPGAMPPGAMPPGAPDAASPAPAAESAPGPAPGPAPVASAALPRAGFWIRIIALLLDAVLVGFVMEVLHHLVHLELVVLAVYGAVMWKLRGSTIGGIVFDLQVVRLDGRPIDWETAIVRALSCFLSLAVAGLGFFWIAFDDGKQAWHDKIAGTVVVRVAKGAPSP